LWVLGFGFWVLGFGFWVLSFVGQKALAFFPRNRHFIPVKRYVRYGW